MADCLFELWERNEGGSGRVYFLPKRTLTVGRAADNDIVLPYQGVSRHHARLSPEGDTFQLVDLQSHNGTLVNGRKVTSTVLQHGDMLRFGRHTFEFRRTSTEAHKDANIHADLDQATLEILSPETPPECIPVPPQPPPNGPDLLIRVSQLLTQAKDEVSYLREVLSVLLEATGALGARLYLYPKDLNTLSFQREISLGDPGKEGHPSPALLGNAIQLRQGTLAQDDVLGSVLCQPIYEGQALALVICLWRGRAWGNFLPADLAVTGAVGQLAIFGLARLSLGERLLALCGEVAETQRLAAVGQLAAGIIHEIRNPLGFVYANLQQLSEYADDLGSLLSQGLYSADDHTQKLIQEIVSILRESLDGTQHIATLTRDVLGFTRRDKDQEAQEAVDLIEITESALTILKSELRQSATLFRNFAPDVPKVRGHRSRLLQVLLNVIANALQALPRERYPQNRLEISIAPQGGFCVIIVSDNGMGISQENLEKIFDPFFTTKPSSVGTGLGLAISRDIVQNHKGTLTIKSEPGQGTQVIVTLPVAEERVREDGKASS